ncbi:hypothetical protein EXS57_01285 [Candidatus Kaiserbacteria bacterium]|nr:hypothetical protein [Candidatus Kaiserbacteria bacterium]
MNNQNTAFNSSNIIPLAIVVGGIIIAMAVYLSMPKSPVTENSKVTLIRSIDSSDHIFGNPAAKVVIVEYSDFDCGYCKTFNETLHQIIANEGAQGDVAWVFRQFPLLEIHPNALSHARATECVAETAGNDMFWKFETALFANQPVDPAQYGLLAKEVGVTGDEFAKCYANSASTSSTIQTRILSDRQNALDIGAKGTPYSVILTTGKEPVVVSGGQSYEEMRQLVNQALDN